MRTLISFVVVFMLLCLGALVADCVGQEKKGDPSKADIEMLQGTWTIVMDGEKLPKGKKRDEPRIITFQDGKFEIKKGDKVLQAGTHQVDATKNPKTIDLTISAGDDKGLVQLGIYEISSDTLNISIDTKGEKRPTGFKKATMLGNYAMILQRERKAGVDPKDASIVYDEPWRMIGGFKAYNGKAYDVAILAVDPKQKIVVPSNGVALARNSVSIARHDNAEVHVYMEKQADIRAHFARSVSIADYRKRLGCAVKLEKGELLIGTFGEFSFLEGSVEMKILIVLPQKQLWEGRIGLSGGYGGRAGADRLANAINPARDEAKPLLTKAKPGSPNVWLAPTVEDGWHEIPSMADATRRAATMK